MFLPRFIRGPGAESEFFLAGDANFPRLWHQPHSMMKGLTSEEGAHLSTRKIIWNKEMGRVKLA